MQHLPFYELTYNLHMMVCRLSDQEAFRGVVLRENEMWVERAMQYVKRPIKYRTTSSPEKLFTNFQLKQLAIASMYKRFPGMRTFQETMEDLLRPVGHKDAGLIEDGVITSQFLGAGQKFRNCDNIAGDGLARSSLQDNSLRLLLPCVGTVSVSSHLLICAIVKFVGFEGLNLPAEKVLTQVVAEYPEYALSWDPEQLAAATMLQYNQVVLAGNRIYSSVRYGAAKARSDTLGEVCYAEGAYAGSWVVEVVYFVLVEPDKSTAATGAAPPTLRLAACNFFQRHGMRGVMHVVKEGDLHDVEYLIDVRNLGPKFIACGRSNASSWLALPYRTMSRLQ